MNGVRVTSPQSSSRNPHGWTMPVWDMKQKPVPAEASPRHSIQSMGLKGHGFSFLTGPLPENAVIVRRAGGFQLKGRLVPLIVKPVQRCFILGRVNGLVCNIFSPARRHQQKYMVGHRAERHGQILNFGHFIQVGLGDWSC